MTFDRPMPHDPLAEASVIASMLVDPDAPSKVQKLVAARDFYREHNGWTFDACMALWERGTDVNQITVANELDARGKLEEAGGHVYLSELVNDLATPVGVESWAALVKQCALYRQLISAGMDIVTLGYGAADDYEKSLAKAEASVYALRNEVKTGAGFTLLRELLGTYLDVPESNDGTPRALQTIHTGIRDLDAILMGLRAGDLVIVGAQTSVGKTALMCNITANTAVTQDARVAFFTLEMTAEQLARRFLAGYSRVTTLQIERREYTENEYARVLTALGILDNASVYIKDARGYTMRDIRRECLELARDKGLDLVVIDYLGKITHESEYGTDNSKVGKVTKAAAELAGDLDVPVILGSQLRRFDRADQRPNLSDLRDSGNIEQDATVVIFIHREERTMKRQQWEQTHPDFMSEPYPLGMAELSVAKNRNGPLGMALVRYRAAYTKFEDFDLPSKAPVQGLIPAMYLNGNGVGAHA